MYSCPLRLNLAAEEPNSLDLLKYPLIRLTHRAHQLVSIGRYRYKHLGQHMSPYKT